MEELVLEVLEELEGALLGCNYAWLFPQQEKARELGKRFSR
jgi:hypothetical protein